MEENNLENGEELQSVSLNNVNSQNGNLNSVEGIGINNQDSSSVNVSQNDIEVLDLSNVSSLISGSNNSSISIYDF